MSDENLDPVYACVQSGHAVAQYLIENPNSDWQNNYLIYLKADLSKLIKKLDRLGIYYTVFREPDLDNRITAVAVLENRDVFKRLQLVR